MIFRTMFFLCWASMFTLMNCGEYTLSFNWKISTLSSDIEVGHVIWNEVTILTLKQMKQPFIIHEELVSLDFREGINQLGFYFIGVAGRMLIDNVTIFKPPSTINLIVNGDFELQNLGKSSQTLFKRKNAGWNGQTIIISKDTSPNSGNQVNQVLTLNSQTKLVTQTINFGIINKYSFVNSINDELQKQASDIIAHNLQKFQRGNVNPSVSSWASGLQISSDLPEGYSKHSNINNSILGSTVQGLLNKLTSNTVNQKMKEQLMKQIQQLTQMSTGSNNYPTSATLLN